MKLTKNQKKKLKRKKNREKRLKLKLARQFTNPPTPKEVEVVEEIEPIAEPIIEKVEIPIIKQKTMLKGYKTIILSCVVILIGILMGSSVISNEAGQEIIFILLGLMGITLHDAITKK